MTTGPVRHAVPPVKEPSAAAEDPAVAWEELVTAALLGTGRRRPPSGSGAADPAVALLDAAAVSTVRRRAGLRAAAAGARPAPAPPDARPTLPAAARQRLAMLLAGREGAAGGRRGTAPDLGELLPQWLEAASAHGYRAPAALVPALLEAARSRTDLRQPALVLAGPRAGWLARLNPEWRFALRGAGGGAAALPDPADADAVRRLWEEGLFAERVSLLTVVRQRDPATGLALLRTTWSAERAEDRLMFLDALRTGLSGADEAFLEQALSDRSRTVRATAAELLSALPGSGLAARMGARAAACVRPDRTGGAPSVVVEAPRACDAAMQRDGVVPKPPAGRGERAWWLGQLVEAAPLDSWSRLFGGLRPEEMVALPVTEGWRPELHAAWCRAAVRQRDAAWSRALLGRPGAAPAAGAAEQAAAAGPAAGSAARGLPAGAPVAVSSGERAKLLAALPAEERAEWVAGFIAAHGLSEAFPLLGVCAVPWAGPLGRAVVDALDIAREGGGYPWSFSGVMGLAERCLDPAQAGRLEVLTAVPGESEEASPGAGGYWSEAFQRLVATLRLRATMLAELAGTSDPSPPPPGP